MTIQVENTTISKNAERTTSGFTQAGAQLVRHFVSNSCFRLSSEPRLYPRLREAAGRWLQCGDSAVERVLCREVKKNNFAKKIKYFAWIWKTFSTFAA